MYSQYASLHAGDQVGSTGIRKRKKMTQIGAEKEEMANTKSGMDNRVRHTPAAAREATNR